MKLYLQRGWDSTRNWRETVNGKEYVKVDYGSWNTFILMDLETENGNEI